MTDGAFRSPRCWRRRVRSLSMGVLLLFLATAAPLCRPRTFTEMVLMRDGMTHLATKVFLPPGEGPWPVVLIRTPYDKEALDGQARSFTEAGIAVVAQDIRGRYASEGTFRFFLDDGWGENADGYDTLRWISEQSWNDGRVCSWGGSAVGITQYLLAGSSPPGFTCLGSIVGTGDLYHGVAFQGGAFRESLIAGWLDAIGESQNIAPILAHATYDEFWHPVDLTSRGYEAVGVPGLHIGGWYDIFAQGTIDSFVGIEEMGAPGAQGAQKLVIGPWTHAVFQQEQGDLTFPENATNWTDGDGYGDWFRHYLLGEENGADTAPAVTYYVMGDVDDPEAPGLEWRSAERWPVASEPVPFYLHGDGSLSETPPQAGFSSTTYVYNPANPVPTLGGNNLLIPAGPVDQRPVEDRSDVLLFTTGVFSEPIEITGRVSAILYVSSSAVDTDFTVKLTDVYPDGRSILLLDGILRMRYREGFDREVFMEPGTIYEITVDLWSTSIVVNRGHRLRVAVSSSNAPRFDVNPNTGEPIGEATTMVVATQTLYHDAHHPSRLILPVVE